TALLTLVSLLSRMGMQVALDVPDVDMCFPQMPFAQKSIRKALIALSEAFIVGARIESDPNLVPDLMFVIGDSPTPNLEVPCWHLVGGNWDGALTGKSSATTLPWSAEFPIGAMVSAVLAAGEAFKFVMRRLPFRNETDRVYFEESRECRWSFGAAPTSKD